MKKYTGWGLALLSVLIFSTNTPIARGIILEGMDPLTLVAGRFTFGALLFWAMIATTTWGAATAEQKPFDRRIALICLVSGGVNGITLASFYTALTYLEASLTSVLGIALFPSFTLLFLALGGEALTRRKMFRLAIVMLGLYFLLGFSGELNWTGMAFVLLAATTYAAHLVSIQWYMKPYNTWMKTTWMMTGASVVVVVLWLVSGAPMFVPGVAGWIVMAYQAVILTFIGRTAIYAAISYIGTGQMALLTPVETVLTIIWSIIFLGESLTPRQTIGAALILLSALLAAEFGRKTKVTPTAATLKTKTP